MNKIEKIKKANTSGVCFLVIALVFMGWTLTGCDNVAEGDGVILTNIKAVAITQDELFKESASDEERNKVVVKIRQPISVTLEENNIRITSLFMQNLAGTKISAKVKGIDDEVIILDHSNSVIQPFMNNTYAITLTTADGIYETVNGDKISIPKVDAEDIISLNVIHNDRSLKIIENLKAEWTLGFSGTDGARYIRITREHAKNYIQIFTNMNYAFGSQTLQDCLNHFSYMTRAIFIKDVKSIYDGTQVAWWHFDKNDPYYDASHSVEFLDRVGVTLERNSHWNTSIDTVQSGVASSGGAKGGGWIAMSNGFNQQNGEDVANYALCHEFGHSRGWQHGSACAYGVFTDGRKPDGVNDLFPSICKTLLHMRVLPYQDQFAESAWNYRELDQIEAKVYLSGKGEEWWSKDLYDHVQRKVKAINDYADSIDNENLAKINLIKERVAFLKKHFENWKVANNKTGNNNGYFIQWRDAVSNNKELAWMKEDMPGRSGHYKSYWDEINETYGTGTQFDKIEEKAVKALSNKFNRDSLLNKWKFTTNTNFFAIADDSYCEHTGHPLTAKDR